MVNGMMIALKCTDCHEVVATGPACDATYEYFGRIQADEYSQHKCRELTAMKLPFATDPFPGMDLSKVTPAMVKAALDGASPEMRPLMEMGIKILGLATEEAQPNESALSPDEVADLLKKQAEEEAAGRPVFKTGVTRHSGPREPDGSTGK